MRQQSFIAQKMKFSILTLIWVGFLGVRFEVAKGADKITLPPPLCLKLVRIILETTNLASKYTHIFSFRKYTF